MESAGSHAYVSKNFIDKYLKKKQQQKGKQESVIAQQSSEQPEPMPISKGVLRRRSASRSRSRSRSRSNSNSGGCRSVESIFEGELEGDLNLSDLEPMNHSDEEMQQPRADLTFKSKKQNFVAMLVDSPRMMAAGEMMGGAGALFDAAQQIPKSKEKKQADRGRGKKFNQEVDTNVFCINMSTLKQGSELATGDPIFCTSCNAAFNMYSHYEEVKRDEGEECQLWICEFCNTKNTVHIDPEEVPKTKEVNYIVEAAAQVQDKKLMGKQEISVVFAIDISGSMCVSKQIVGKHSIKGDKIRNVFSDLMKYSDVLCAFNHEVTIIGDGSKNPQIIAGDKLYNYDYLIQNGETQGGQLLQKSIKETNLMDFLLK